jgi:hypothetical protein
LDDDFLHSQWTSLDYEANSKLYKNTSNWPICKYELFCDIKRQQNS